MEACVGILGDLLVYSDNISLKVKERVEEVEQQLEVADKQLRSTRAFLEEQAAEREMEREEWDRRLAQASQSRRSSKSFSRGNTGLSLVNTPNTRLSLVNVSSLNNHNSLVQVTVSRTETRRNRTEARERPRRGPGRRLWSLN